METDVIVVGSGGAGLIAALHAAVRGARVTVLEKGSVFGGTTTFSGGAQWIPLNPLGKQQFGLQDSSTDAELYLEALSAGQVPKQMLSGFVREAPQYFEFLAANASCDIEVADIPDYYRGIPGSKGSGRCITIGEYDTNRLGEYKELLRFPPMPGPADNTASEQHAGVIGHLDGDTLAKLAAARREKGVAVRGRALIGALMEACLKHKVELVHSVRVSQLTQSEGRVIGVLALREGKAEQYQARQGVVLASGGFEWNRSMWDSLIGTPFDGPLGPPVTEGDGLRMALSVGARLGSMNQVWWSIGGLQIPGELYDGRQRTRATDVHTRPGSITVNRQGRRFMNENMPYYDAGRPLMYFDPQRHEFSNYPAFSLMDRETYERAPLAPDVDEEARSSFLFEAPTLHSLAEQMGVDPDGLADQVKAWNDVAELGVDPTFHRGEFEHDLTREPWETIRRDTSSGLKNPLLRPIGDGPYYGVQLKLTCFATKGGAVIDAESRVLGFDDNPIPGLFAAGNVSACVYGAASPGGGSTLGPALTMGWVAGRSASA